MDVRITPNLPQVHGERVRLVQVLQYLADNAFKFMGGQPEPRIEIGCRSRNGADKADNPGAEAPAAPAAGHPIFYVQDNGIGVESRFHEKIFGLLDQLDKHTDGTGIGLTLVKRIVELHGGEVWVESEGAGRGS